MIQIEDLCFNYDARRPVFENLSISLLPGSIYGLLGENGAGKSTFLKIIAGLAFPKRGTINVMGYRPKDRKPDFLEQLFIVPEQFTLPNLTPKSYAKLYAPFYANFDAAYFASLLGEFEIPENHKLSALSYGQRKKVLISFALATQTRLLLMDEPTNGLDIPSKSQFRRVIAAAHTNDRCFIISTHQLRDLNSLMDSLIVLAERKILINHSIDNLTRLLQFRTTLTPAPEALYTEQSLTGYHSILPNTTGTDSLLDTELLFKALLSEKSEIRNYLTPTL